VQKPLMHPITEQC